MKCYNVSRLPSMIELGFDGENNWRPNSFDCSALLKNHPNGVISLWLLPQGESQAFPVALTRDGNSVIWTPLSEEMTAATGALQIVCTDGTDVGKSAVVMFRVSESIVPGAEHPAAVPSWATQTIERAEDAAERAEEAAESIDIEALEARIAQAVEDYLEEHPIEAPVQSVNGKTGAVTLGASDVGALPANTPIPPAVTVDSTLSDSSENPVQNKVINAALQSKGTYSKPSGGIPKTDLASDVQTSLGKADTALQQHQSLSGYATETWVQNRGYQTAAQVQMAVEGVTPFEIPFTTTGLYAPWVFDSSKGVTSVDIFDAVYAKRPIVARVETNGDVEIVPANLAQADKDTEYRSAYLEFWTFGDSTANNSEYFFVNMSVEPDVGDPTAEITVDSNHRVKKTLPAVSAADNGKSLVVDGGVWGKGYQAARIPRIAKASTDTVATIDPNKLYVFPEMASLEITLAAITDNTIVNEYHFIFTSGATATTLTLPSTVNQPDGFTVDANMIYEVSILENCMTAQGWAVTSA